jgi:hypothetical protein
MNIIDFKRAVTALDQLRFLYFFDSSAVSSVTVANPGGDPLLVAAWASRTGGNHQVLTLAQTISADQPKYLTSNRVNFADTSDGLIFNSPVAQAGWQIVGTSRGTFAYRINASSQSNIRLFGNQGLGPFALNLTGDLYGVIYLHADSTPNMVEAARQMLIQRGATSEVVGTNIDKWWIMRADIVEFGFRDFSAVTNFFAAWNNCTSLTSFPLINTSSGTNFFAAWQGCTSLTSFPLIDTSIGTDFRSAWQTCPSLTSFPLINTSSGTNFRSAWQGCTSLTSFPLIDTSSGTNFFGAWQNCTSLTSFPLINTSIGTNFQISWQTCTSLTSFPLINTSSGTNFLAAWNNCTSLTSFPLIYTSSGTNFFAAWQGCTSLTSFPLIDTSIGTDFRSAWNNCTSLTSFPAGFFDSWTGTPVVNCFLNTWANNTSLTATSVEHIFNSLDTSGRSAPATGTEITVTYSTATGTPNITTAVANLKSRGWTPRLNGTLL